MEKSITINNPDMVRSVMSGQKTLSHLICRVPESACRVEYNVRYGRYEAIYERETEHCRSEMHKPLRSPYAPGDLLYVKEPHAPLYASKTPTEGEAPVGYVFSADTEADIIKRCLREHSCQDKDELYYGKWRPAAYMPRSAARIWIRVKDVRLQRLQEITFQDIQKEGLNTKAVHAMDEMTARAEFAQMWNSVIQKKDLGRCGWEASPYVWRIEFERVQKPQNR